MIKHIFETTGSKILIFVVSFAILILTTQFLGAEGRGIIGILTTNLGLISLFTGCIGGSALVFLSPRHDIYSLIFPSYLWGLIVSLLGSLIISITGYFSQDIAVHIFFLSFIASIINTNLMIFIGKQEITENNLISIFQIGIQFLILGVLLLIFQYHEVNSYIISLYASSIVGVCLSFFPLMKHLKITKIKPDISKELLSSLISLGFISQAGNIIQFLNYRLSFYILEFFNGYSAVGVYSVGVSLSESLWLISSSISLVQYGRISNQTNQDESIKITVLLSKYSFILTLFLVLILVMIPPFMFSIVFGKDFSSVHLVLLTLSPGVAIFGFTTIISHYYAGIGKYSINTYCSILGLIATLLFNYLLVPHFGYIGAGLATSISYLITAGCLTIYFIWETKTPLKAFIPTRKEIIEIKGIIQTLIPYPKK